MLTPMSMECFTGPQRDPRVRDLPIVYGLGSYVPHALPATLEYVYIRMVNTDRVPLTPESLVLETESGLVVDNLDLPEKALRSHTVLPGCVLAVGFLRDLFCKRLRDWMHLPDPLICRFRCRAGNGGSSAEATTPLLSLSLNYPRSPLQDIELSPYAQIFAARLARFDNELSHIRKTYGSLRDYANLHLTLGMHRFVGQDGMARYRLREWMPGAGTLWLTTDRVDFSRSSAYEFRRIEDPGVWELVVPANELPHGTYMELRVLAPGVHGPGEARVPAFARWVQQDRDNEAQWCARVWDPATPYMFRHQHQSAEAASPRAFPMIYEAHPGIAQPAIGHTPRSVGSYAAFARDILPRIRDGGYTAVQLMGIPEHPLYKSFGYQVSGYFAPSSRFGTPDDFKAMVDTAHGLGLSVIVDIPHSHACPNTEQGIARYDTTTYLFADKDNQWGTVSFDYDKEMTRRFLLSNCRYWMEEYRVDGFRFDAVGNMIYNDHGFGDKFTSVDRCFYTAEGQPRADENGILYLQLANTLLKELPRPGVSIAEEFSGMPGMTSTPTEGGLGFDYRFAMGIPDFWAKFIKEGRALGTLWHEMTNHRRYERTISYVACHDQCINGKDSMLWRLIGDEMYTHMSRFNESWSTSRGVALYKLMRLVTLSTASDGMLTFMGDEFGHPEWIDDEVYAHRQWHLTADPDLKYAGLAAFDRDTLTLVRANLARFMSGIRLRHLDEDTRLLAFERGNLLFLFNFHEHESRTGWQIMVTPGKYVERLSSDADRYAGPGNLELATPPVEHFSDPNSGVTEQHITVYLPPMVALILEREE